MTDIVERLRAWAANDSAELSDEDLTEAADEIVKVRDERDAALTDNARLRALITGYVEATAPPWDPKKATRARLAYDALREEANR